MNLLLVIGLSFEFLSEKFRVLKSFPLNLSHNDKNIVKKNISNRYLQTEQ